MRPIVLLFLLFHCLFAHSDQLTVMMSATSDGSEKPIITGTTNLPDGIELMITIERPSSSYMAQAEGVVKSGMFKAGPFSQQGKSLNPGIYTLEVSTLLAMLQPPKTWPIIGNEGAKLKGRLVKKSDYGGNVVEYKTSFRVGGGQSSTEKDIAARTKSKQDKHKWWLKSCSQTCLISQNVARANKTKFDWDQCYFKCVADEP